MLKRIILSAILFTLTVAVAPMFAQKQVGIPVKLEGFVFQFSEPFDKITIEVGKNLVDTNETVEIKLTPQTAFLDNKKKSLDKNYLRSGLEVEIKGEKLGSEISATSIQVKTDLKDEKILGYFERLDKNSPQGEIAWISGQTVRFDTGAIIAGDNEWKGKTFKSFDEMMLGSEVELRGERKIDGIFYVKKGQTRPNMFTQADNRLREQVRKAAQSYVTLPAAGLTTGKIGSQPVEFMMSSQMPPKTGEIRTGKTAPGQESQNFPQIEAEVTPPVAAGKNWIAEAGGQKFELLPLPEYLAKVGNSLVPEYQKNLPKGDPSKIDFRFYVVKDNSFNAFALPDGTVVVHSGLLAQLTNESQLAAVLGHEIAHVTHEHSRRKMRRESIIKNTTMAACLLTGNCTTALLVGNLFKLDFSRDLEDEADRVGLYYLSQTGYDPRQAPQVWRQVLNNQGEQSKMKNFLYSGHSRPTERMKNLNREIALNQNKVNLNAANLGTERYLINVGYAFGLLDFVPRAGGRSESLTNNPSKNPRTNPPVKTPTPRKPKKN